MLRLELGLQFGFSIRLGLGLGYRFFFFNKLYLFQMIGFYGLLDGYKARTEVLPSAIPRA